MKHVDEFSGGKRVGKIVAALALAFAVLAHPRAAAAVDDAAFKGTASGDFVWNVGDTGGNLTGSFSHLGHVTAVTAFQTADPTRGYVTFLAQGKGGDLVSSQLLGTREDNGSGWTYSGTGTIQGGTGKYAGASGTFQYVVVQSGYLTTIGPTAPTTLTVSGTISLH